MKEYIASILKIMDRMPADDAKVLELRKLLLRFVINNRARIPHLVHETEMIMMMTMAVMMNLPTDRHNHHHQRCMRRV